MGHVDDRWHKRVDGRKVRSDRYGHNPRSRWAARWIDPAGAEKQRSFETRDAAETWLRRVETQLESGQYIDPKRGSTPLSEYAERWFTAKATKTSTRTDYRSSLDAHVLPRWGNVPVSRITEADVREWVGELSRTPSVRRRKRDATGELVKDERGQQVYVMQPLSAARIGRHLLVLTGVLEFAKKDRAIYVNPAEEVDPPKGSKRQARSVGQGRLLELRQRIHERDPAAELLVAVLATTGIRWGELVGLDVVDLQGRQLHIRLPMSEVHGRLVADTPKGHRDRYVALPPALVPRVAAEAEGRRSGPLFRGPRGGRWRMSTWRRRWDAATEAAGAPGLKPHELRHLYASESIAAGADVKKLQRQLGHATATLTLDTYAHWLDAGTDEIADAMDALAQPLTVSETNPTLGDAAPDGEAPSAAETGGIRVSPS